jgi:hypothetical protein
MSALVPPQRLLAGQKGRSPSPQEMCPELRDCYACTATRFAIRVEPDNYVNPAILEIEWRVLDLVRRTQSLRMFFPSANGDRRRFTRECVWH